MVVLEAKQSVARNVSALPGKKMSLLALEETPAFIKSNKLILLIWKLRPKATDSLVQPT